MYVSPLDVTPIIARITSQCAGIKLVGRAADNADAIENGPKVTPAAFVLEPSYKASGKANGSSGLLQQMFDFDIPVLVCCQNYAGATQAAAGSDNYTARSQVWLALLGFVPLVGGFAIEGGSGKLLKVQNKVFYYLDIYRLRAEIRNLAS